MTQTFSSVKSCFFFSPLTLQKPNSNKTPVKPKWISFLQKSSAKQRLMHHGWSSSGKKGPGAWGSLPGQRQHHGIAWHDTTACYSARATGSIWHQMDNGCTDIYSSQDGINTVKMLTPSGVGRIWTGIVPFFPFLSTMQIKQIQAEWAKNMAFIRLYWF